MKGDCVTRIIFIRHGEPDYGPVRHRNFTGHGLDLAQLTAAGLLQAEKISHDNRLNDSELIVSSPYTRALQTAAIVSKNRGLDIKVELDLHEWLPDMSFRYTTYEEAKKASELCTKYRGVCPEGCEITFENLEDVFTRAKNCLLKYLGYKKIIVVAHGVVMRQFAFAPDIPFCGIREIDFDEHFRWGGFIL